MLLRADLVPVKTTLIKKLLHVLDDNNAKYKLASPTGRAAKRITESTGRQASTLHRLLEFDVSTMSFTRNESNALNLDFLIIDEASMLDVFLAYAVLKAVPLTAHVVFIGDIDQLPSVGAGNFLKDLIASKQGSCIRLTQIYRQAQDSMIVLNAHRINNGEFPISAIEGAQKDFIFIKEDLPENVPVHLKKIYDWGLKKVNIHKNDSMVLVPMHRGSVGTQKLNGDLQTHFKSLRSKTNFLMRQIRLKLVIVLCKFVITTIRLFLTVTPALSKI